jgi:hypothetical protein
MDEEETPRTPSGKPYDPKTWEPEDGDPFAGNGYDKSQRAVGDAIGDVVDPYSRPLIGGPIGFALDLVWRYFFPRKSGDRR